NPQLLNVEGNKILDGLGEIVTLRGFCLGGWMNMENFMAGYPGHESGFRDAIEKVLGREKAGFFFERFLHHFFGEDDLRFIKELGCNVIRSALNYRHFESDDKPFQYKPEGFARLDKVIGWARSTGLYVILDLHAVQGWQSSGWHCDNPGGQPQFWGQKHFEDRAVALWEELALRYCNEVAIAGYNVMNEPEAHDVQWLNHYYRRVTSAIRAIDPDHILYLEGNHYSRQFTELDPPFDSNTVYSSHLYVPPGLIDVEYPGTVGGVTYDRDWLEKAYLERRAYTHEHNVPHWMGEFGPIYNDPAFEAAKLRVMADYLDIIEEYGDHWTIWNYKDIGKMGIVYVDPESEWMRRTQPVRGLKTTLCCDSWVERQSPGIASRLQGLTAYIRSVVADHPGNWDNLEENLGFAIGGRLLSQMLLPAFAEQFSEMNEDEIERMMQSFAFENCVRREGLVNLVKEFIHAKG
ncbi:MAG: glycoside hydrolase family 5 protein, partial [Anaerolineales bacterium]